MATPQPQIHTYHCLCSTLLISTFHSLSTLPLRSAPILDHASILPTSTTTNLHNLHPDPKPTIIERSDGFEKRLFLRCTRCGLVVGYQLDGSHFEDGRMAEEVMYILPGGLVETEGMMSGRLPEGSGWDL